MSKGLILGAVALLLSAGAATAQVPGYDYNGATVPLYVYGPPVYAPPPLYAVPAPPYGYYVSPYGYPDGSREWAIEKNW
jgi:hypothetical protein